MEKHCVFQFIMKITRTIYSLRLPILQGRQIHARTLSYGTKVPVLVIESDI